MREFTDLLNREPQPIVALAWLNKILQELGLDPNDVTSVTFDGRTFQAHHVVRDVRGHPVVRDGQIVQDLKIFAVSYQLNLMTSRTLPPGERQDAPGNRPAKRLPVEHPFPGTGEPEETPEGLSGPYSDAIANYDLHAVLWSGDEQPYLEVCCAHEDSLCPGADENGCGTNLLNPGGEDEGRARRTTLGQLLRLAQEHEAARP